MKSIGFFSFVLSIIFAFATISVAYSANDNGVGKKNAASAGVSIVTPRALAPATGNVPGSQSGSNQFAGSCCEKPTPFPGLYCCDTRDCGWFDCDATISSGKKFKTTR